ncbi:saccharopine dehydrogenase-like oxidoreductase [Dendronephthya gigantea]|uniref:saccharopine dehydrogenase-like oxidoreductase n=1 Tax=Dendronephthya gigantea TaxID=151771 RepID=UPI001069B7CB|nr:saccharopine dehydrogenase-like oxidoreductase [Dendronephthya gigantea]
MSKSFDVVIFGASGFTGQFVVQEFAKQNSQNLRWAVAGRNRERLQDTLQQASDELGKDYSGIDVIIADVKDEESLNAMCAATKMVLNCVGPYRFFGEPVVKACVENDCHHLDVSGEPEFLETMQFKYDEKARESKIFVIGTCGFDSIPADMGIVYTQRKFPGQLCHVESFLTVNSGEKGMRGHYGTYHSLIYGIASEKEGNLKKLRKELFPNPLPRVGPKLKMRGSVFYGKEVDKWSLPFLGADPSVVRRTQRYRHDELKKPPVQYSAYFTLPSIIYVAMLMVFGFIFMLLASFDYGRKVLEKYPKIFSFGIFSHEGPTKEERDGTSFSMTFYGKGFSKDYEGEISPESKMDKKIVTRIIAPEPGYVATPICMVQAAIVILSERETMPESGGVLTPGAAFADTTLIERLDKAGVRFVTVEEASPIE